MRVRRVLNKVWACQRTYGLFAAGARYPLQILQSAGYYSLGKIFLSDRTCACCNKSMTSDAQKYLYGETKDGFPTLGGYIVKTRRINIQLLGEYETKGVD